jgi:hypothetical protein
MRLYVGFVLKNGWLNGICFLPLGDITAYN